MPTAQRHRFVPPRQLVKPAPKTGTTSSQAQAASTITHHQSLLLMKGFLEMAVGSILYQRGILPDANFVTLTIDKLFAELPGGERFVEIEESAPDGFQGDAVPPSRPRNYTIKVLNQHTEESAGISDAITRGAMAAIQRGYLRSLMLLVLMDPNNKDDVIEVSTFNFFYGPSGVGATVSTAQETTASIGLSDKPMTVEEVITSIRKAFKHILIQSRNLDRLPTKRYLDIKLVYTESAPANYEPLGFKLSTGSSLTMASLVVDEVPHLSSVMGGRIGDRGVSYQMLSAANCLPASYFVSHGAITGETQVAHRRTVIWDAEVVNERCFQLTRRLTREPSFERSPFEPLAVNPHAIVDPSNAFVQSARGGRQPLGQRLADGQLVSIPIGTSPIEIDTQSMDPLHRQRDLQDNFVDTNRYLHGWTQLPLSQRQSQSQTQSTPQWSPSNQAASGAQSSRSTFETQMMGVSLNTTMEGDQIPPSTGGPSTPTGVCAVTMTEQAGRPDHALSVAAAKVTSSGTRGKRKRDIDGRCKETLKDVNAKVDRTPQLVQPGKGLSPHSASQKTPGPAVSSGKQVAQTRTRQARSVALNDCLQSTEATRSPPTKKRVGRAGKQVPRASKTVRKKRQMKPAKPSNDQHNQVYPRPVMDAEMDCSCRRPVQPISPEFSIQCDECSKWYHSSCAGFSASKDLPEVWVCLVCRGSRCAEDVQAKINRELSGLSVFRRVLVLVRHTGSLEGSADLKTITGCTESGFQEVLKRLVDDGFIETPPNGSNKARVVPIQKWNQSPTAKAMFEQYFTQGGELEQTLFGVPPFEKNEPEGQQREGMAVGSGEETGVGIGADRPANRELAEQAAASQDSALQVLPLKDNEYNNDHDPPTLVPVQLPHAHSKSSRLMRMFDVSDYQAD